jgi:phosphonate transport system substrate-binding protein
MGPGVIHRLVFLLACFLLAACQPAPTESYKPAFSETPPPGAATLVFGVHPMHSPQRLFEVYQPLVDYLNRNLPEVRLRLEVSRDYAEFERRLANRHFHFALPNPYQTVVSWKYGYRVFGKLGDDDNLRGVLIVRRDSGIEQPADLRGKAVSYPAPTALAATMLPQWFLHQAGINVRRDLQNQYVGTQESSIMNVYLGKTAAGATWLAPWVAFAREHPDIAAQLELKWKTPPLVNYSLVAREGVPPELVARVQALIIGLDGSKEGRNILARMELSRFEAADDRVYQPVAAFVERFEREVRPAREP